MVTKRTLTKEFVAKAKPKKTVAGSPKTVSQKITTKPGSLSVPMFSLVGVSAGTLNLPKELFGEKVNKALLAQAIRVYSTNQRAHFGNTKTRGEVVGSTRKIYRQKGTGNARHGAKSAPIFVGGGVTFAPKSRKTTLDLPKKMKKAALLSAFAQKVLDGQILAVEGLEKASGKTKQLSVFLGRVSATKKQPSTLMLVDQRMENVSRAVRNIQGITFLTVTELNAYEVIRHQSLLLTKAAVERLQSMSKEKPKKEVTKD